MRAKRAKQYKKAMNIYKTAFDFREPYQILHLRAGGDEAIGAVVMARKYERRRCTHASPIKGSDCLAEILGTDNKFNYCVATQNEQLRKSLRKVAGTPLLHINRAILILEPPSSSTLSKQKYVIPLPPPFFPLILFLFFYLILFFLTHVLFKVESAKTGISAEEKARLVKLALLDKANDPKPAVDKAKVNKKRKRVGPKQPNPLSVKKPKKAIDAGTPTPANRGPAQTTITPNSATPDVNSSSGTNTPSKPKRKRKRKSKSADSLNQS
ncbi:rRNA-processing protein utp23 [Smittium culicis]|uniref:rRNA-processing protein utp23 n=1 Tax=Smittium culicis TaxID=133412 RepID=A0A1R1XMR8_9FUNG|nr:rRNA-processing protein utp23 [Smittium culicis]